MLIFLSGFSLAVPYYLPSSIFIVDLGGKKHCTSYTHAEHMYIRDRETSPDMS